MSNAGNPVYDMLVALGNAAREQQERAFTRETNSCDDWWSEKTAILEDLLERITARVNE